MDELSAVKTVQACAFFELGVVYAPLYLVALSSFLRMSNLVPNSFATFDISRYLARGDCIFTKNSDIITVTWSKTIQDRTTCRQI